MRRPLLSAALTAVLALTPVVTGCSGDEPAPVPPPTEDAMPVSWNPCSGLDTPTVARLLEASYVARTGTEDAPTCTFTPDADGEPVADVNYQTFPGSLDELLATFGAEQEPGRTRITRPEVRGADDARLITVVDDQTLIVTAFVRNGLLVQILNVLDPAPYDRPALLAAVEELAGDLAANAETSGLTR